MIDASDRRQGGREPRPSSTTVNPATQEVLADVASGGEAEVAAAVAAAKAAFPKWAGTPQATRAQIMRQLGDLIARARSRDLASCETRDTGRSIDQTTKALMPRAADNFYFFAEVCTRMDGHTLSGRRHDAQLHAASSRSACAR